MSETRQRAAKRALGNAAAPPARERTPSPRTPAAAVRRTRRRVGSSVTAAMCGGASEPESEDSTQEHAQEQEQQRIDDDGAEEPDTSSSSSTIDAGARTPDADTFSVISGDASPHGSVFDFLALGHADPAPFSLFTPSPGLSKLGLAASPRRPSSALSSPSRFFRSPFNASAAAQKKQRKRARPMQQSVDAADGDEKQQPTDAASLLSGDSAMAITLDDDDDDAETTDFALRTPARKPRATDASAKEEIPHLMDMMSLTCSETLLSPWPRSTLFAATPSPPSRVQLLSRRLKDDFDREQRRASDDDDDATEDCDDVADELYRSAPSGLAGAGNSSSSSSGDQDSFFAFANALSPLVHADEFESNFLSVRLSPLVSLDSYDLPRLIPPFPMPHLDDEDEDDEDATRTHRSPATARSRSAATPKTPLYRRATITNYASGGSSGSAPSSIRSDSMFPNIQASTSATPGKSERSKLGAHSIMTMKLHVSGSASTLSHSKREIEAINNSLRKKSRKRKLEDKRGGLFKAAVPVQRKLLQTPLKTESSHQQHRQDAWSSPQSLRLGQTLSALETPIKVEQHASSYSVLSTHATPPRASSSTGAAPSRLATSTPVASSTLVMTPSSNWKKSRSMPPSGLTPGAGLTPTPLGLRTRRTPPRRGVSISTALPVASAPSLSSSSAAAAAALETPSKAPVATANALSQPLPTSTTTPAPTQARMTAAAATASASATTGAAAVAPPAKPKRAPCNCKKSKCLKLYCECFASGGYCDESCNCQGCANTPAFETMRQQAIAARLEKNPNAFKPKIESTLGAGGATPGRAHATPRTAATSGAFATPVSGVGGSAGRPGSRSSGGVKKMHKNGCHCKKSACQKKYCECFQAGVACGDNCRCIDCKNQSPCVSHATGGTRSASATPSRLLSDVDETFVSPVLHNVRQRLRIDRETWAKNFSSPLEVSPRRERERNERLRSHLRSSTAAPASRQASVTTPASSAGRVGVRVNAASAPPAAVFTTPTPTGGTKRQKLSSVSPVAECPPPAAAVPTRRKADSSKTQTLVTTTPSTAPVHKAPVRVETLSSAAPADRVVLYPLFGDALPPVKRAVSAQIFHCLTNADLYNASLVSKLWSHVALGDAVWDYANYVRAPAASDEDHS